MSRHNRPMRRYVAAQLVCERCRMVIHGETRMLEGALYHPVCAAVTVRDVKPKAEPA